MPTALTASNRRASSPGCAGRGHPVGRQLDFRSSDATGAASRLVIASPTAMRAEAAASSSASGVRSPIAIASPAMPSKSVQRDRAIGHRHLPRADHLVARGQAADGAIADGDQEVLGGHGRMREHAQAGLVQVERVGVQLGPARRRRVRGVAMHLRRLAEQHVHRQVDGGTADGCVDRRRSRPPAALPPSRCRPPRTGSARARTARRIRPARSGATPST